MQITFPRRHVVALCLAMVGLGAQAQDIHERVIKFGHLNNAGDTIELTLQFERAGALTVQAVLVNLGVDAVAVELQKPEVMLGGTDNAQARRVEVVVAP